MAAQVIIDISEYKELEKIKNDYQKLINDGINKAAEDVTKDFEEKYRERCRELDTCIQKLNKKEWILLFAGWSKSTTYFPTEVTRTRVWKIVPRDSIKWYLVWINWVKSKV